MTAPNDDLDLPRGDDAAAPSPEPEEAAASGAPPAAETPPPPPYGPSAGPYWTTDRLYRSVHDRVFAGVCGGLAERYGLDPALVRIAWAILTLLTGILPLLLLYVIWALVVPEGPAAALGTPPAGRTASTRPAGSGAVVVGVLLIAIGAIFLVREYLVIDWDLIWPVILIVVGVVIVLGAARRRV